MCWTTNISIPVSIQSTTLTLECLSHYLSSGILKLDLSWFPLAQFFEDKFKWAEIVARTKEVRLIVEDNTVSTMAGLRRLLEDVSRSSSSMELVVSDIEGDAIIVFARLSSSHSLSIVNYIQMETSRVDIARRKIVLRLGKSCLLMRDHFCMWMCLNLSNPCETL